MKITKKIFILSACLTGCFLQGFSQNMCQLTIRFATPDNSKGKVYFLIFDNPEYFGDDKKAYNYGIINPPAVTVYVPYGEYGVTCFQDIYNKGELKTNFLGIPKEPVGASNNPKLKGHPKWKDVSFKVSQPVMEIVINLKKVFN
jgi:uncharacterized protein (DUF2141 family)